MRKYLIYSLVGALLLLFCINSWVENKDSYTSSLYVGTVLSIAYYSLHYSKHWPDCVRGDVNTESNDRYRFPLCHIALCNRCFEKCGVLLQCHSHSNNYSGIVGHQGKRC